MVMYVELQAMCSALDYQEGSQYIRDPDCLGKSAGHHGDVCRVTGHISHQIGGNPERLKAIDERDQ